MKKKRFLSVIASIFIHVRIKHKDWAFRNFYQNIKDGVIFTYLFSSFETKKNHFLKIACRLNFQCIIIKCFSTALTLLSLGGGRGGGRRESFSPAANLNLNYFCTACGINLRFYDFSYLLLEGVNIFLYRRYCQKIGVRICRNSFSHKIKYLHV